MSYFLGANTPYGFYSLFNELYNPDSDDKIYLIKGGPGTGKSSIMKRVASEAEKNGYDVIRIPCSSDPSSLDAIIIPELKLSFADATSPHIINPVYPGVSECTIELGQYWNKDKLESNKNIIKKITKENSLAHKKCIRFLKAAAVVDAEKNDILKTVYDENKITRFIKRIIDTELNNTAEGECRSVFMSAVTPKGITVQYDTLFKSKNILTINDKYGYASSFILKGLNEYCEENDKKRIKCLCPLNPENKIDHLLFDNLAIFTANTYHPMIKKSEKNVNCERFIIKEKSDKVKNRISFLNKTKLELISEAIRCLEEAKKLHDILESYYISAMDFSKVSDITKKLINECFT